MPIVQGINVPGVGPALGSLTLSANPPYGPRSNGQLCATITGQSQGTVLSLLVGETGQFTISPDGTQLCAGPAYNPAVAIIRIREARVGYFNSPLMNTFDFNGLQGVVVPKIAAGS